MTTARPPEQQSALTELARLLDIMERLRDPHQGCPWDVQQTFASIAPYTIEEAYEVAEAVAGGDLGELKDELGDLLLQVVFHAQMAAEQNAFGFAEVAAAIGAKMVRRHPHVFGAARDRHRDPERVHADWESIKKAERGATSTPPASVLDGVSRGLPAFTRATKLQRKAAQVGFDWPGPEPVTAKIAEELAELEAELTASGPADQTNRRERLAEELGDLLFACTNLARHLSLDPDQALRRANRKFEQRFRWIETRLRERGQRPQDLSLQELEQLWQRAKDSDADTDFLP